jgi:uncharacterized protein YhaN
MGVCGARSVGLSARSVALHVLTKFLVVLAAVLCVLLSGLAIAYTSNADRLVAAVQSERSAAEAARAAQAQVSAASALDRENAARDRAALESQLSQFRQSVDTLTAQVARLEADNKRLSLGEANYVSQIEQALQLIDANTKLADARAVELNVLRQKELDSARKEIELTDRINDLSSELEVARETGRALREQMAAVREGGAGVAGAATEATGGLLRAPRNLRARVTDVQTDVNGSTLVSIDAGQSDQLKSNMKLNLVRDGEGFLGSIVLERVDLNEAVGRIVLLRQGAAAIRSGDLVLPSDL